MKPDDGFAKVHYGFILKAQNKIAESIPYLKVTGLALPCFSASDSFGLFEHPWLCIKLIDELHWVFASANYILSDNDIYSVACQYNCVSDTEISRYLKHICEEILKLEILLVFIKWWG